MFIADAAIAKVRNGSCDVTSTVSHRRTRLCSFHRKSWVRAHAFRSLLKCMSCWRRLGRTFSSPREKNGNGSGRSLRLRFLRCAWSCPMLSSSAVCRQIAHIHSHPPQRNNKLVWDEALRVVNDMFENVWGDKDVVELDHVLDITIPVSLLLFPPSASMTPVDHDHGHRWSEFRTAHVVEGGR